MTTTLPSEASPSPDVFQSLEGVSAGRGLDALTQRLVELRVFLADDLAEVERGIGDVGGGDTPAQQSVRHLLDQDGKRLRPICVALAARAGAGFNAAARVYAVAVEMVHNATLLHDDVVDVGDRRRGADAARVIYGNAASIFGGDWLLVDALCRIQAVGQPGVLERMLAVVKEMVIAESLQLARRGEVRSTAADYFSIISGKTASLFRWAMFAGARAGGLDERSTAALELYGQKLGIAFQIVDDVLDVAGDPNATGKAMLTDMREGKMTYPLILAMERDPSLAPILEEAMAADEAGIDPLACARVARAVAAARAGEDSLELATKFCREAVKSLEVLPPGAREVVSRSGRDVDPATEEVVMIVSLKAGANPAEVLRALVSRGLWVSQVERSATGEPRHYVIAAHSAAASAEELATIEGIAGVTTSKAEHPKVSAQGPVVDVAGVTIGEGKPTFMVGPCSVESEAHVREIAERLAPLGVAFLRGGAYKPRTSPYAFQGHGEVALGWLRRAAEATGLKVVTEALSEADVPAVAELADLVQVGSRNMQNYALLKAVGRTGRPVLLKRGMSATMDEWLHSGEYLLAGGARGVIFCERGIRSFDDATRNLLDLGAVALLAHVHKLPVIVDPSHGVGRRDLIVPLGRAALAAGAAGLMIETHADPASALSDGPQAVPLAEISTVMRELRAAPRFGGGAS